LWYRTLAWRWRRWRAGHYLWAADLAVRRLPTARNLNARNLAADYCRRVDHQRP
jgi:hypothetical protein